MRRIFSEITEKKEEKRKINSASLFGLFSGAVLFFSFGYRFLYETGWRMRFSLMLCLTGAVLFILGGFFPDLLIKPFELFNKVFKTAGKYLLRALMLPVYLIFSLTSVFVRRSVKKKYSFYGENVFSDIKPEYEPYKDIRFDNGRFTTVGIINNIISFFVTNGMTVLLPVILILLIVGIVFFFLSTSSVFSFIYTLF